MSTLPTYHSLSKVLNRVKSILDDNVLDKKFWLKVEITNINFHRSGHIYMDFAENSNGITVAKCKANIWNFNIPQIRHVLGHDFNNILKKGNEILCYSSIRFDPVYGLSLLVSDVNLEFAVGKIEQTRQETIDRLKKEDLIDLNKLIKIPVIIKTVAVIASENTSGFQDFIKNIQGNQYGYKYNLEIFSAAVQGNNAENEILNRLKIVNNKNYDCVVVIRGGGSKMDLDTFNSYAISKQVSQMKSPVFSGIGHETDITVIDFTSNKAFKTPTEVSNFIVNRTYNFEQKILRDYDLISETYGKIIDRKFSALKLNTEGITNASNSFTRLRRGSLHLLINRLLSNVNSTINEEKNYLSLKLQEQKQLNKKCFNIQSEYLIKQMELVDLMVKNTIANKKAYLSNAQVLISSSSPKAILSKGFAITRVDNNLYRGEKLKKDTIIKIEFADSVVVTKYVKNEKSWKINPFLS